MSEKYKVMIIFSLILCFATSANIIPDSQNPLQMMGPTNNLADQSLVFRFMLSSESIGLNYKHFIGVSFPSSSSAIDDLKLAEIGIDIKWTCEFTDGTNNIAVSPVRSIVSPTRSESAENNIAYCRIDDMVNIPLKPNISYKLTLKFKKIFSTNFIRSIGLFTSTANHSEKIIIDSQPVFGNIGMYGNWEEYIPRPLDVTNVVTTVTTGPSTTVIYPSSTFNLSLTLKVNSFISINDVYIVVRYPSANIGPAQSVVSSAFSDGDLNAALKGSLSLSTFSSNSILISGITDELIPNRTFKLDLNQWRAADTVVGTDTATNKDLEVIVYYKNTYSVFSYSKTVNTFIISKTSITISSIKHPEDWDIYRSGAWPLQFTFKTNSDLINGGIVLVQHTNAKDLVNRMSFIPSSCDFSEMDSFDTSFSKRPNCYPYRYDFAYSGKSGATEYNGSAFFFNAKSLLSSKEYKFRIWIYADNCGGNGTTNFNLINNPTTSSVQFKFKITVYKDIKYDAIHENRLNTQVNLGDSSATTMSGKCWNMRVQSNGGTPLTSGGVFDDNILAVSPVPAPAPVFIDLPNDSTANLTGKVDVALFKEIHDWSILSQTDAVNASGFSADITTAPTESYIYSTSPITNNSYFMLRATIYVPYAKKVPQIFALPFTAVSQSTNYDWTTSKSIFRFSKDWFAPGDDINGTNGCYVSWGWNSLDVTTASFKSIVFDAYNTKYITSTDATPSPAGFDALDKAKVNKNNFITSKFLSPAVYPTNVLQTPTIDTSASTISTNGPFTIISTPYTQFATKAFQAAGDPYDAADTGATAIGTASDVQTVSWTPFPNVYAKVTGALTANNDFTLGLFSNCIKWKGSFPSIKSIYTSIEVYWNFSYANAVNRVNRFVKLYPEGGVFQDKTKLNTSQTTNPLIIHYTYVDTIKTVCLLELSGSILYDQTDPSSNTLLVWIYFGTLLETDYKETTATYPVAPLLSNISSYGFQTGLPASKENGYFPVSDDDTKSSMVDPTGGIIGLLTRLPASGTITQFSSYHLFMGSLLAITNITNGQITSTSSTSSNHQPILIPFYCPYKHDASENYASLYLPAVMTTWMNMSTHTSFAVQKFVGYQHGSSPTRKSIVFNRLDTSNTPGGVASIKATDIHKSSTASPLLQNVTLRFSQYTDTTAGKENILYLFNNWSLGSSQGSAAHCTGQSLFIKKDILLDTTVTQTGFSNTKTGVYGNSTTTKTFLVWGKQFHRAFLTGSGTVTYSASAPTNNIAAGTSSIISSDYYWTGIKRPTVDTFTDFDTTDYLAYYCASNAAYVVPSPIITNTNVILSNYFKDSNVFILDYNPDLTKTWGTPTVTVDRTEQVIKGDVAANFKMSVVTPVTVPSKSKLSFTANNSAFTANTICGIVSSSGIANDCDVSTLKFTCIIPNTGTTFNICCYNIALPGDTFSIATLTLDFNPTIATQVSTYIYSAANQIAASSTTYSFSTTGNASTIDTSVTTFKAYINTVKYTHLYQEGAYGKAQIEIALPRQPTRDMKITIIGDFTNMLISNNLPRCRVSFDSQYGRWDNGDALIDGCSTSGFVSATAPVIITTKRIIYKCGQSYGKTLYVWLWPIVVSNWAASTSNSYKVSMQLNSGENIANNDGFNMPSVQGLDTKPSAMGQLENLCAVTNINPRIPGELAEYTFEFDLDTNKASLSANSPNEVTLFFPYNLFGSIIDDILCYYNSILTNCSFTDEGILNIRFSASLPVGTGKKIVVIVNGITNPSINTDFYIPCTVNFTNFSTQKRLNLITGTGKVPNLSVSDSAVLGALRLLSVANSTQNKNFTPRNQSSIIFRINFDGANGLSKTPLTIANNPFIMITFPSQYKLAWFPSIKPQASIDQYTSDASTNKINKGITISPSNVVQSGNRLFIYLPDNSYIFENIFRYWDIKISGITAPMDSTLVKTVQTTSAYKFLLTNSNYSSIFRTYSNLNSHAFDPISSPADNFISYHRGNKFDFDGKEWVLDVKTGDILNSLTLRPGRYFLTNLFIKQLTYVNSTQPSIAEIKLSDPIFKTLDNSYTVYSSMNEQLPFLIGCACGTAPGSYLINFILTIPARTPPLPSNWAPLSPVQITVVSSSSKTDKGTISYNTPSTIPAGGSIWVSIVLSEPNFDELNISWTDADNSKNDKTAKFEGVKIPPGTITSATLGTSLPISYVRCLFSITNGDIYDAHNYKSDNPNLCYNWQANTIILTIQGQTAIIPQDYDFVKTITFYNSDSDGTLSKNAIRFNIKMIYAPVFLYCALVCSNSDYPSNDLIKKPNTRNTELLQYYSGIYTTASGSDIIFSGLLRGQKYKLRCIIESVQGDTTKRTSTSGNFEKYTASNGTVWDIMPSITQSTYCAQFLFNSDPGQETKIAMIQYCQRLFSAPGWSSNGCVVCTDSDLSYIVPGVILPDIKCVSPTTSKLRFLQQSTVGTGTITSTSSTTPTTTTTTTTSTTNPTPTTAGTTVIPTTVTENKTILFSVCAISSPSCAKDVTGNKAYLDYFNQLKDDLSTQAKIEKTLSIVNAQVSSVSTYSDAVSPSITTDTLKISSFSSTLSGLIKFKVSYQTPLKCYYQISTAAATAAPSFDSLVSCTGAICGAFKPSSLGIDVSTEKNLSPLAANTNYNVFIGCTNDIPYSQKRSNVIAAYSFTSPADTINNNNPNATCTSGQYDSTGKCISSEYFKLSLAIMILLSIIFN